MIDESLLAKVSSLSPAERLELIGVVWDTLSPDDLAVTDAERLCSMRDWPTCKTHPDDQISLAGSIRLASNGLPLSYEVQVRRAAELDIAEAQVWYETQQTGVGTEFVQKVSRVIDRLAATPLIYQTVHRDIRRAIVRRFPYLIWYRVVAETVIVLACTYAVEIQNASRLVSDNRSLSLRY